MSPYFHPIEMIFHIFFTFNTIHAGSDFDQVSINGRNVLLKIPNADSFESFDSKKFEMAGYEPGQ